MKLLGWIALDKNHEATFFAGEEQPRVCGAYKYMRNDDQGKLLPDGFLDVMFGDEANWHYGKKLFAIYG